MFDKITGTATFNLLGKALDTSVKRHEVISNNIANVDTPKFKRQIVTFEEEMAKAFDCRPEIVGRRTDPRHFPINDCNYMNVNATVITDKAHVMRNDKNNVDINVEMSDLAKNTMTYQICATRLASMFAHLNDIIVKGGRA
ncbi:MAG: flagellar basal body rod protein FlgB [Candidatus Riflebacteria bacterium]|nr:flagellar basal body rod protein FlgB [Candidatus Riflebacteria bacterium]